LVFSQHISDDVRTQAPRGKCRGKDIRV